MKRKFRSAVLLLLMFALLFPMTALTVRADQATTYTYTLDDNYDYIRTQDAYLPNRTLTELGLNSPSDLYIDTQDRIYIADSGNRRVLVYDIASGEVTKELTSPEFSSPSGVFVTASGNLYVADPGAKAVFIFDKSFELTAKITKPDSPLFSDTNFEPKKVAADDGGNIYVISEGVYNGIIQLASTGEFLGYFAVNDANLSLSERIQRLLFTREQIANLVDANPTVFTNVFVDQNGIVYSVTSGLHENGMKKHSTNGGNMFKETVFTYDTLTDVYVDRYGFIYTCTNEGYIDIYSKNGEMIFEFGSFVTTSDVVGLFTRLPSIAVDSSGSIWAVDGAKGYLQSFKTTEYARMVYNAMNLYEEGYYEEALAEWNEVLKLNQMSVLAHDGAGKAYLHAEDYENALEHFKVANDKEYYSEAFWEVRNTWLQNYLGKILFAAVVLFILVKIIGFVDDRTSGIIAGFLEKTKAKLKKTPILRDFLFAAQSSRHPNDCYYEISKKRAGSIMAAAVIYLVFFVVFMLYQTKKGFIYQMQDVQDMDIGFIALGFWALLGLFILCNYLVTSINDGNGTLKQIFMVPAYGSLPAMVALLTVTVVSYGLTYNESFLLTIIMIVGIVWSLVTIFLGLQTIHEYSFKETVTSIFLTLTFMLIIAVVLIILSIMWNSLWSFITSVGKEMYQNAF